MQEEADLGQDESDGGVGERSIAIPEIPANSSLIEKNRGVLAYTGRSCFNYLKGLKD